MTNRLKKRRPIERPPLDASSGDSAVSTSAAPQAAAQVSTWRAIGLPALASAVVLWAAQPPLGLGFLVWLAPLGLVSIIDRPCAPGRTGYFQIWLAGCLFWLANLQGIRLAFWPLYFGWIVLALYLAVYFPLAVGLARSFHWRWRWPLSLAVPTAWVGLELVRSYLVTGFAASTLAHSQTMYPVVIQLADQVGVYGVSFIIMAVAVAIFRIIQSSQTRQSPASHVDLALPGLLVAILFIYGAWRLTEGDLLAVKARQGAPLLRVALLQENTPSMFDADLERLENAWARYQQLTGQVLLENSDIDLVVWPESTFGAAIPWLEDRTTERVPAEMAALHYDRRAVAERTAELQTQFFKKVSVLQETMRQAIQSRVDSPEAARKQSLAGEPSGPRMPHLLVGNDAMVIDDDRVARHNSALLIDPEGKVADRYDKIHLVMFGEYIPLNWALGFLGEAFGMGSATPGQQPRAMRVGSATLCPSICFESVLPQFISWQVRSLVAQGQSPNVLINVTNDSWFRGSSILDLHLACEVMAAVEMRRPFLVAANTGLTAWVAGSGRIIDQSPRLEMDSIVADVWLDNRWGLTQWWGDLPGWMMAAPCGLAIFAHVCSLATVRRRRRT